MAGQPREQGGHAQGSDRGEGLPEQRPRAQTLDTQADLHLWEELRDKGLICAHTDVGKCACVCTYSCVHTCVGARVCVLVH